MKYIITYYGEVVLITEADSRESLILELETLCKPYKDAHNAYLTYKRDTFFENYNNFTEMTFRGKKFPMYYFAHMGSYEIYPLDEFLSKHTI